MDLIPRGIPLPRSQESDYAILTFPPPPPAIDLLNESMASTTVNSGGLGSTSMLNAITPGTDRMAMPLPNPAMAGVMPEVFTILFTKDNTKPSHLVFHIKP